jgi:PAS domain-containing protein
VAHVLNKWFGRATAPTTIRRQLQGALVGVSMLVTLVIGLAFYYEQRREILSGIDKKLETVAVMARELLPPDYHDRIDGPDSVSPEAFHKIVERNNRLCRELGLEYIWSLLIVNGTNVFTTSTSPDKIAANRLHAKFFEPHSNPELYTRTLTTMRTTFKKNHDKWGDIRVVLIPDTDARGRPYLFGASVRLTDVNRQLAGVVCQSVIFGLSVFLLSLVVSVWVSERVTLPICRLTDTIRAVAAGERALEADESGTVEQATLAKCFNQMNRALQDKIHDLEEARQRMIGLHDAEVRQFESSLDMSGQRFQALLDFAADGILIGSHDGYIIDSNQKMCELFGLRREEILGKHILEMPFTPESMHQTPFRFDAVRKGDLVIMERVIRRRDGS